MVFVLVRPGVVVEVQEAGLGSARACLLVLRHGKEMTSYFDSIPFTQAQKQVGHNVGVKSSLTSSCSVLVWASGLSAPLLAQGCRFTASGLEPMQVALLEELGGESVDRTSTALMVIQTKSEIPKKTDPANCGTTTK